MTLKKLIFADKKDEIKIICENLRASDASVFYFCSLSAHGVIYLPRAHDARTGGMSPLGGCLDREA
ncbi:MAG: hypothetical protein DSY55_03940 [Clostridia bacterium]|nr:MAG: hypothetical protein DSY55_03940 [Clostridia bacterium]